MKRPSACTLATAAVIAMVAAGAVSLSSTTTYAGETQCSTSGARHSKAELTKLLKDKGWKVKRIKEENGCFEVYAYNPQGKRVQAVVDPHTLKVMGNENE